MVAFGAGGQPWETAMNTLSGLALPPPFPPAQTLCQQAVCNEAWPHFLGKSYFLNGSRPSLYGDLQYRLAKLTVFWTHQESLLKYTFLGLALSVSGACLELRGHPLPFRPQATLQAASLCISISENTGAFS